MTRPKRDFLSVNNMLARGIPKTFLNKSLSDFEDYGNDSLIDLKNYMEEYLSDIDKVFDNNVGLFLHGSNGTGKTFISSLIVKEAYHSRYTSKRVYFQEYINEYAKAWGVKDPEEREELIAHFYNDYKGVEFLVLDEVGKEIDSKISVQVLDDCLRYREDKGYVTIICTNLDPKRFGEKYGTSIFSLVKGNQVPILLVGADKRKESFRGRKDERK